MATDTYPELDIGRENGVPPSKIRIGGRKTAVVGAVIDGDEVYFDNGILTGKARVEDGITFGPEVLRALGGRRVIALWLAATTDDEGRPGWYGMTVGEMRIDRVKGDGFRDVAAFQTKFSDAASGRTAVWQLKEPERLQLAKLLASQPELWRRAAKSFRDTMTTTIPSLLEMEATNTAAESAAVEAGSPRLEFGMDRGHPPRTLRSGGRDVTIVGALIDGAAAEWANGVLDSKSRVEEGITFGPEVLRAMGGKRYCGVWVAVTRNEEGHPGYYGISICDMRIDAVKKDGWRDVNAHTMKLNNAAIGRVELYKLKPEEKQALATLLKGQPELWKNAVENLHNAFD